MEVLTANLGRVRREVLHGREFLVGPSTLIVPGVLPGSKGPLLYTESDVGRHPDNWNRMPIVVNHPVDDGGAPTSARRPKVLDRYQIGDVYETVYNGRLVAEAWFDVELTRAKDQALPHANKILPRLERGEPIELSTGLYTRNEPVSNGATHRGVPYTHVARDYRPDHLAVLPDSEGACSLKHGCGVLVNGKNHGILPEDVDALLSTLNSEQTSKAEKACSCAEADPGACECEPDCGKLGRDHKTTTTVSTTNEGQNMGRDADITYLTTNCDCWRGKADSLKAIPDDTVIANLRKTEEDKAQLTLTVNTLAGGNARRTEGPKSAEQWYADAPAEIQEVVRNAKAIQDGEKLKLVERIVANNASTKAAQDAIRPTFTAMSLPTLQTLAANLPEPTVNGGADNPFSGLGLYIPAHARPVQAAKAKVNDYSGAAGGTATMTANAADDEPAGLMPTINEMSWAS